MIRTLAFIICLLPTLVFAQREVLDKVIAQIGGESLLQSEVEDAYTMEAGRNPKVPTDLRCQIVENLLLQKLLTNQAKIDSVVVSNDMVENQLNARVERIWRQEALKVPQKHKKKGRLYLNSRLFAVGGTDFRSFVHRYTHKIGPPPINESISGVNPDKIWIIYRRHINGKEALYG